LFPKNAPSGGSLAAVALLCCAALVARAGEKTELHTSVEVEQDYDSNIFYDNNNEVDSGITIIRPSLSLENHGTLGHTKLYGFISEHIYTADSVLNGFDRGFGGDLERKILPRTTIFANGSYQRLASHLEIRGPDIVVTPGAGSPVPGESIVEPGELIEGATPDVDLAQGTFGMRQDLTPRLQLVLSGGPFSIDYLEDHQGLNTLRDRSGWFGGATFQYALTPIDQMSLELQGNSTDFADAFSQNPFPVNDPTNPHSVNINTGETTSDQQSLTLGWTRSWSELWSTTVAVGGRRLHTRTTDALRPLTRVSVSQFGIVPFVDFVPVEFDDTGPGVVGELSVTRLLPRGQLALSYTRETRTTSSLFASDVNVDTVALGWIHRLSSRVTFTLRGSFEHYTSVNDNVQFVPATFDGAINPITGPEYSCPAGFLLTSGTGIDKTGQCQVDNRSSLNADSYNVVARLDWQLRKRLSTFVLLRYGDRNGDEALFGPNYDKYNVGIGFRYDYTLGF
jgi:hypothetical protein